nr:maco-A 151 [Mamestra configurata nucleopolyhedrovirus A]WRQ96387.1 maco-A 151 [Mamestra configurata nucleopolyhedrovirus A]WRQ96556.1 maco-A 151 [Mamestra configurata nucleopolyhedrovirus A]
MSAVVAIITRARICGLHEATVVGYETHSAILIVAPNSGRIIYDGLQVNARIIRQHLMFIDLMLEN